MIYLKYRWIVEQIHAFYKLILLYIAKRNRKYSHTETEET